MDFVTVLLFICCLLSIPLVIPLSRSLWSEILRGCEETCFPSIPKKLRNLSSLLPHFQQIEFTFTLALSFLPTEPGYPEHLAPLDPSSIDPSVPLPSPLVPPKTPPRKSDYVSSTSWIQPPSPSHPQRMNRSRSSSTSSSSDNDSSLYETDSEAAEDRDAQLQFEESIRQLQSLVNLVVVPWVSRYFGRKWSYYRKALSSLIISSMKLR